MSVVQTKPTQRSRHCCTMTLHRILLATLACVPAGAFNGVPPVATATKTPAHRLLGNRIPVTKSITSASFQQQQQQRRRSPPPQRACLGHKSDTSSAFYRRTTTSTAATAIRTTTTTALSLCNNPSASVGSGQEDLLLGDEADGSTTDGSKSSRSTSASDGSSSSSTLGISHSVLERTIVPALYGAVLKQSPSDFVVVEIPLYAGSKFTPSDANAPIPEPVRKPVVRKVRPNRDRCN